MGPLLPALLGLVWPVKLLALFLRPSLVSLGVGLIKLAP